MLVQVELPLYRQYEPLYNELKISFNSGGQNEHSSVIEIHRLIPFKVFISKVTNDAPLLKFNVEYMIQHFITDVELLVKGDGYNGGYWNVDETICCIDGVINVARHYHRRFTNIHVNKWLTDDIALVAIAQTSSEPNHVNH